MKNRTYNNNNEDMIMVMIMLERTLTGQVTTVSSVALKFCVVCPSSAAITELL